MDWTWGVRVRRLAWIAVLGLWACGGGTESPAGVGELAVWSWGPSALLPGTTFVVRGSGFVSPQVGEMTLTVEGSCATRGVVYAGALSYVSEGEARWGVPLTFVNEVLSAGPPLNGTLTVSRKVFGYSGTEEASAGVTLTAAMNLAPAFSGVSPGEVFFGDEVHVVGDGFLSGDEGQSVLVLTGTFAVDSPPMVKGLEKVAVPLSGVSRQEAVFALAPDVLGVLPGLLSASGHVTNFGMEGVAPVDSAELSGISLRVLPTFVDGVNPTVVRRGQKVEVTGRGFVETDPVGEVATLLLLDGVFTTTSGKELSFQGPNAMLLFPDAFTGNALIEVVLRVTLDVNGKPQGLGLMPGTFAGKLHPELFLGGESFLGPGYEFSVQVAPQLQVVYVKVLPSFDEALSAFGLGAVKGDLRSRILARCNRDYSAFNVQFVDVRPEEFAEYSVIELSGEDPNNAGLLGLDNTAGKDVGNLRFNDVVGGKNAETEERGYYAYGGVFLKSFLSFSPSLSTGTDTSLATVRFDDIFGPFIPELGGTPVEGGEYPGGKRAAQIDLALHALGNLIGGTVAHEVGHTLGLAMVPGQPEEIHDPGDNPAYLMDAGAFRPFGERAEIDGQGPEVFAPYDFDYLQSILPKG